jgi:ribonuclease HI
VESHYDAASDVFELRFGGAAATGATPVHPGVDLLLDAAGRVAGFRVRGASERLGPDRLGAAADAGGSPKPAAAVAAPANPRPMAGGGTLTSGVVVYTDGACVGNPGPGGWAVRVRQADGTVSDHGGAVPATTNNRMELLAAIRGLEAAAGAQSITVVTDSQYLRQGITAWIRGWKRNGWVTAAKTPVLNQDLWQQLDQLNGKHVSWRYTRGHAGDPDNERCDQIAQAFARGRTPDL